LNKAEILNKKQNKNKAEFYRLSYLKSRIRMSFEYDNGVYLINSPKSNLNRLNQSDDCNEASYFLCHRTYGSKFKSWTNASSAPQNTQLLTHLSEIDERDPTNSRVMKYLVTFFPFSLMKILQQLKWDRDDWRSDCTGMKWGWDYWELCNS
jgi:hypothetical protein